MALTQTSGMVTASQLAEAMGLKGDAPKGVARALLSLKEQSKALELRPGKWASPGTGGEFPVTVEAAPAGSSDDASALFARFDAERSLPIPQRPPHGGQARRSSAGGYYQR